MIKKWFLAALLIVAGIVAGNAANFDGKWKGSIEGPNGSMDLVFTFKVDGAKLTGTVSSQMGDNEITNGKVEGDSISFVVDTGQMKISHKGKMEGDVIKLKFDFEGGGMGNGGGGGAPSNEMTLTRVKE
jgi:hypothetical protein